MIIVGLTPHVRNRALGGLTPAARIRAEASGLTLPGMTPTRHFSKRQDMVAWPLQSLAG